MNSFKELMTRDVGSAKVLVVLVVIAAITAVGLIVLTTQDDGLDNGFEFNDEVSGVFSSIDWDAESIVDQDGEVILSVEDFPSEVNVSEGTVARGADHITEAKLSPSGDLIAITTGVTAHSFGWIYDGAEEELVAVVYQGEGEVNLREWARDSRHIVFQRVPVAPQSFLTVVEVNQYEEYVEDTGFTVHVEAEEELSGDDISYVFLRWDHDQDVCFELAGTEYCINVYTESVREL